MIMVSSDGQAAGLSKAITHHLGITYFPLHWESLSKIWWPSAPK
jgi:hypothetical protein